MHSCGFYAWRQLPAILIAERVGLLMLVAARFVPGHLTTPFDASGLCGTGSWLLVQVHLDTPGTKIDYEAVLSKSLAWPTLDRSLWLVPVLPSNKILMLMGLWHA